MMASRSAMATACVRVSASSLARMCRTWLFTVSWLMNSCVATSAFDIPSARSWRIWRSRPVRLWSLSRRVWHAGIGAAAPLGERDGGLSVGGLTDHPDVRRSAEREAKPFAHDLVIVNEQAGDLGGSGHGRQIIDRQSAVT